MSNPIKYCKVKFCRFPHTHTTKYHQCGSCKTKGHGVTECRKVNERKNLEKYMNYKLPIEKHCTIPNCPDKETHTSESHICHFCNKRHSEENCIHRPNLSLDIILDCPICRQENTIKKDDNKIYGLEEKCKVCFTNNIDIYLSKCGHACLCLDCASNLNKSEEENYEDLIQEEDEIYQNDFWKNHIDRCKNTFLNKQGKIFTKINAGMGCLWFFKRENNDQKIKGFFLHSDSYGQYGENHIPYVNHFTFGYKFIKQYDPYQLF